jgi:signal transduction histidine kinase
MKPLKTQAQDAETLRELGGASVQIIHDLKNQLNGLKLYATFLRKRLEKAERPADELDTLAKLIAGLERAAGDMTTLVRYGRGLELRPQSVDLARLVAEAADGAPFRNEAGLCEGEYDPMLLSEALKSITNGGRAAGAEASAAAGVERAAEVILRREADGPSAAAVVEWRGGPSRDAGGEDPFRAFAGGAGLRLALAAKIIRAHGGEVSYEAGVTRARLPITNSDE